MRKPTRLTRIRNKNAKKGVIISLILSALILAGFFYYGIPLLANIGLILSNSKNINDTDKNSYIPPPYLNSSLDATNSAEFILTGKAGSNDKIKIFQNDQFDSEVTADNDGKFEINLKLDEEENILKAKVVKDNKLSDFSNELKILLKKTSPTLEINSPIDGETFSKENKTITVSGSTDPDTNIKINEFIAVLNESNNFTYNFVLKDGENIINITAVDNAGNKSEKTIKVHYSP